MNVSFLKPDFYDGKVSRKENEIHYSEIGNIGSSSISTNFHFLNPSKKGLFVTYGADIILWEYIYDEESSACDEDKKKGNEKIVFKDRYFSKEASFLYIESDIEQSLIISSDDIGDIHILEYIVDYSITQVSRINMRLIKKISSNSNKLIFDMKFISSIGKIVNTYEDGSIHMYDFDLINDNHTFCCQIQSKIEKEKSKMKNFLEDREIVYYKSYINDIYNSQFHKINTKLSCSSPFEVLNIGPDEHSLTLSEVNQETISGRIKKFTSNQRKIFIFGKKITFFNIHISFLYSIISLNHTSIVILHIYNNKICGVIDFDDKIISIVNDMLSGLYFLVVTMKFLYFIEFATGNIVKVINHHKIFDVIIENRMLNKSGYSGLGVDILNKGIYIISNTGCMVIYSLPLYIIENISNISKELVFDKDFWKGFVFNFGEKSDKEYVIISENQVLNEKVQNLSLRNSIREGSLYRNDFVQNDLNEFEFKNEGSRLKNIENAVECLIKPNGSSQNHNLRGLSKKNSYVYDVINDNESKILTKAKEIFDDPSDIDDIDENIIWKIKK